MSERLFTTHQVADLLGATPNQVYQWIERGWLASQQLPDGPIRVSERGLIEFLKARGIDIMQLMASASAREGQAPPAAAPADVEADAPQEPSVALAEPSALPAAAPAAEARPDTPPPSAAIAEADAPAPLADETPAAAEMSPGERAGLLGTPAQPAETQERLADEPPHVAAQADEPPQPRQDAPPDETPAMPDEPAGEQPPVAAAPEPVAEPVEPAQPAETQPAPREPAEPTAPADAADQVVDAILADAVASGATHVHLQHLPDGLAACVRIDAALREKPNFRRRLPAELAGRVIDRLLAAAGTQGARADRPRSGRFRRTIDGREVAFGVSALPAAGGTRLVVRIVDAVAAAPDLAMIGLDDDAAGRLQRALAAPGGGLVLAAGLPREGMDEVLAALGRSLCRPGRDVLAVGPEDAVEVPGASLARIDPLDGYSFPHVARELTGQDADAVVVSRLRDPVTAVAALEAALAGRTVVAGLVAPSIPAALGELAEMDLEAWPLASALRAVIARRRLRRLCQACRRPARPSASLLAEIGLITADHADATLYEPVGCERCGQSGYVGTVALQAVLFPDAGLVGLIRRRADAEALAAALPGAGCRPLRDLAAQRVLAGETSLQELAGLL